MFLKKHAKKLPFMEPWRCEKGSKYYNKIKYIRDILKSLSGGNIPDMLIALLTADEVIFIILTNKSESNFLIFQ
jgi:hypothetical protein